MQNFNLNQTTCIAVNPLKQSLYESRYPKQVNLEDLVDYWKNKWVSFNGWTSKRQSYRFFYTTFRLFYYSFEQLNNNKKDSELEENDDKFDYYIYCVGVNLCGVYNFGKKCIDLIKELNEENKLNDDERNYYLNRTIRESWSVKELERQIKDESFDNFLNEIEQNNFQFNIQDLLIKNYKSLVNIKVSNPSKLLVFAGANASGKSNIFEALEFLIHAAMTTGTIAFNIFGGVENVINYNVLIF